MAARRNRRTARLTKRGSNVTGVQKQINTDYKYLVRDYADLGVELMRKPITRYILGGVALTAIVPMVLRFFRDPEVQTFVRDNVDTIRTRVDGIIHSGEDRMESLNQ